MWAGERCFVIGGGDSLRHFDWSRLKGERVVGANMAFMLPCTAIAFFKDQRVVDKNHKTDAWKKSPCIKLVDKYAAQHYYQDCFRVNKLEKNTMVWGSSLKSGVIHISNTGIESVNIADCLRPSVIYLLGFDLNTNGHGDYKNWHDRYPPKWIPKCAGGQFKRWLKWWEELAPQIRRPVINLNPNSSLRCFPKQEIDEVL